MERLSFRNLYLSEFEEIWKESDWKNYFEEINLIIVLYQGKKDGKKMKNGDRILKDVISVTFTLDDISLFKQSYLMVQEAIKTKDISKLPYPK